MDLNAIDNSFCTPSKGVLPNQLKAISIFHAEPNKAFIVSEELEKSFVNPNADEPEPVFNLNAIVYKKLSRKYRYRPVMQRKCQNNNLEKLISKIESNRLDITVEYVDWLKIAGALASVYGESGRHLFHRISMFYPKYNQRDTDRQYSACIRNKPGFNEAVIFAIAKKYNVTN